MNQAILLSQSGDIDFMIHGIIPLEFMGTTVWITTSHACILIVMAIIIGFCIWANRVIKNATEVPGAAQNVVELIIELLQGRSGVLPFPLTAYRKRRMARGKEKISVQILDKR